MKVCISVLIILFFTINDLFALDCCHAESEDGFLKINSFALKDDEQFKICYRNTICIIRRKDEVPEQEFFDSEKSVLEYGKNRLRITTRVALKVL